MLRIGESFADRPGHARRGDDHAGVFARGVDALPSAWSPMRWSGNVVPFLRPSDAARRSADITVGPEARPAPVRNNTLARVWPLLLLVVSAVMHAGAYFAFERQAPPLASVGVQSISVEIVLGTDRAAGMAKTPVRAESTMDAAASQGEAAELVKPETARPEVKVTEAATPLEPLREAPPVTETKPVERQVVRETPVAVATAVPDAAAAAVPDMKTVPPQREVAELQAVVEAPQPVAEPPKMTPETPTIVATTPPEVRAVKRPPPRPKQAARKRNDKKGEDRRTRESTNSSAARASSGVGRGRSDAESNYRGIVAARLARNKHFPPDARRNGHEGRAVVSFAIDGGGRVTSVALVRGTGIATLDREAQAMVHRSSPFPAPPSRQQMRFTVPVNFDIR
jgi:protein TonB